MAIANGGTKRLPLSDDKLSVVDSHFNSTVFDGFGRQHDCNEDWSILINSVSLINSTTFKENRNYGLGSPLIKLRRMVFQQKLHDP